MKKKRVIIPIIAVFAAAVIVTAVLFICRFTRQIEFTDNLPMNSVLTAEQALEDFDYIYRKISENHPCFLDGSGLDKAIAAEYEKQRQVLESDSEITVKFLWRSASVMCHTLGDAHTIVTPIIDEYAEDWNVITGGTVLSIDGVPCGELLEDFRTIFSYEPQVDFYADHMFGQIILQKSWLELLGIDTSDGVDYELQTDSGTVTKHCGFVSEISAESDSGKICEYTVDKDHSVGIFTLYACDLSDEYKNMLAKFFADIDEYGIENVAVDLRENGGGNSLVINEFMKYVNVDEYRVFGGTDVRQGGRLKSYSSELEKNKKKDNVFGGNLYVLTSNYTFSSAMDFSVAVSDNKIGRIIGETPGNMPTAYGDKLTFQCPNSGLLISVSYKKFHRVDSTKDELPLIPDFPVESDKAIEKLYEIIAG